VLAAEIAYASAAPVGQVRQVRDGGVLDAGGAPGVLDVDVAGEADGLDAEALEELADLGQLLAGHLSDVADEEEVAGLDQYNVPNVAHGYYLRGSLNATA
jgi:hypothetical protein